MDPRPSVLVWNEPDRSLIRRLSVAERVSLAAATLIATLNVVGWLEPAARELFRGGWRPMSPEAALATLLLVASLQFFRPGYRKHMQFTAAALALLVAVGCALVYGGHLLYANGLVAGVAGWIAKGMSLHAAGCYVLAGLATASMRAQGRLAGIAADLAAGCFAFAVLILASGHLIGVLPVFGPPANFHTSPQAVLCLVLLLPAVLLQRARSGVFSILLGRGIGSKVARFLVPVLIVLPYFREGLRAHLFSQHRMPPEYITALLATGIVAISVALVMFLAWRLNLLEIEIQGLSLRDPLTGLNNLRGFRLLSEQALRLAYRSGQPFSVLYLDVDNLKQINDAHGHEMGSAFITAAADLLRRSFRETDVLGRIGGDEFAVAGQFNRSTLSEAVRRLRQQAGLQTIRGTTTPLSLSVGSATSSGHKRETLADLLAQADAEMYREKRAAKAAAREQATAPGARLHKVEQI